MAIAWPLGTIIASLPRLGFRWPRGEGTRVEESGKSEVERCFRTIDDAFIQIDLRLNDLEARVKILEGP